MTTGIYLVSACASADDFVAAFRRYADRASIFVPIAVPLPAGRRGQIALTLADGSVMIEGDAEVIQSSPSPSGLHGRVGMTIRFVEPDEPSKIVLTELDRARTANLPTTVKLTPRPASIPESPRPAAPAPVGRIDAMNALAECVAIGDLATLREIAIVEAPKAALKFSVPTMPGLAGRTKAPTVVPPLPPLATPAIPTVTGVAPDAARSKSITTPDGLAGDAVSQPPKRPNSPSTPPMPRHPTPYAPLPVSRLPAKPAPNLGMSIEAIESTDLPAPNVPAAGDEPQVAVTVPKPARSGGMRASEIMAAVQTTENWAMTPEAAEPTVIPADAHPPVAPEPVVTSSGNPDRSIASNRAFTATTWEDKPTGIDEPLVEIDPSLVELEPTPVPMAESIPSSRSTPLPWSMPTPVPGSLPAPMPVPVPVPMQATLETSPPPMFSAQQPRRSTDFTSVGEKRRRTRVIVIGASAAVIVVGGVVLAMTLAGGSRKAEPTVGLETSTGSGSATKIAAVAPEPVTPTPIAPTSPPIATEPGTPPPCSIEVTSVPAGAEIVLDKTVLGVAPGKFALPCGVAAKLTVRKAKFVATTKTATPSAEPVKVAVKLAPVMFSLKITSVPAGATITVGGRMLGITPTSIKLPAYAPSTITLTKDGYAPDVEKVATRSGVIRATLKRRH